MAYGKTSMQILFKSFHFRYPTQNLVQNYHPAHEEMPFFKVYYKLDKPTTSIPNTGGITKISKIYIKIVFLSDY